MDRVPQVYALYRSNDRTGYGLVLPSISAMADLIAGAFLGVAERSRLLTRFLLFALLSAFALPNLPAEGAPGSEIRFHRLSFTLPGAWKSTPQGKLLLLQSTEFPGALMMMAQPSDLRTWTIRGYLENGIQGMEKQEGRRLIKAFPVSVAEGMTQSGHGFAFQTRVTTNSKKSMRYAAYYAFTTGARFQTIIVMATSAEQLKALLAGPCKAFDDVSVHLDTVTVQRYKGAAHSFFNYSLQQPGHWKREDSPYSNLSVFRSYNLPGSNYVFGNANRFVIEYELQPGKAVSPVAALESYLTKRSTLYYKGWTRPQDAPTIARIDELQLEDGSIVTGLALQQTNDDRFYLGAWMVSGPGYSLIVASGFKLFRYDLIKRNSTAQIEHNAWYEFYKNLLQIVASVEWNSNVVRKPDAEQALIANRQFRFNRERILSGDSISVFSSNQISWDFFEGNRVQYKMDKFTSFNDYDVNPSTGTPDTSSGFLTREGKGKDATFQVWQSAKTLYILVMHPAGIATFHPLTLSPFTIDGFQNGCCQ
ncbi:MAG: hypothetical protein KDK37_15340 [Leptospiraceae bacterium]|nr:hypothetical protein [Leptospiraceae bacterium]